MNLKKRTELIKKLLYQSCNRGCKETDLLVGNFAKLHLKSMDNEELQVFEQFLQLQDVDIYDWYMQKKPLPSEYNSKIMQRFLKFSLNHINLQ